jgi:hypothetical protein
MPISQEGLVSQLGPFEKPSIFNLRKKEGK